VSEWAELSKARIWYRVTGAGEPVVLLHGGLTDSRDFAGNLAALASSFQLFMPERRGHGHSPDVDGPLSIEVMADDMVEFIDKIVGKTAHVVGYSVGASVGIYSALKRPDLIRSLVAISGALGRDGWLVRPQNNEPPEPLLRAYAEVSPDGADHFRTIIAKAAAASAEIGRPATDLARLNLPALVIIGDDDFVDLRHAIDMYEALPNAALAILPDASHLILQEHSATVVRLVKQFLTGGHSSTLLPIRRPSRGTKPSSST
jgi:pimeloyl-ACP methyl ester carboxylesterase